MKAAQLAVVFCVIQISVVIATISVNLLLCISFCMVRMLRKPRHYLVVSLAITDIFVAILILPGVTYQLFDSWIWGPLMCDLWIFSHQSCVNASIMNLCALSMDRLYSIKKPLRYLAISTSKRMTIYLAVIWLAAISVSVPPLINGNVHATDGHSHVCLIYQNPIYQVFAVVVGFFIPFSITIFVYLLIHRAVRQIKRKSKQNKRRFKTTSCDSNNKVEPNPATILSTIASKFRRKKTRAKFGQHNQHKTTTILGLLIFSFAFCLMPYYLLALVRVSIETDGHSVKLNTLSLVFIWLGFLNTLIDPTINAYMNYDFRLTIHEILCCRCSKINAVVRNRFYRNSFSCSIQFHSNGQISDKPTLEQTCRKAATI